MEKISSSGYAIDGNLSHFVWKPLSQAKAEELRQRITTGLSKARAAREFGISRETLYKYLREAEDTPET